MTHPSTTAKGDAGSPVPPADFRAEEVSQLKAQLRHAQKLACLGTSAAMLAHEYNNVYAPVVSYAQYALDKDDVALMRKTLKMILGHSDMVQAMSQRILGLIRNEKDGSTRVNLREVVEDAIGCVGRDLTKDDIRLTIDVDERLHVTGSHHQLQQVLLNLIINARQALLGRKGQLKISATCISDELLTLHVRDNGKGIRQEDLARIFDPFFSTKQQEDRQDRRGIGLGLAICKEIIQEHGGDIRVESVPDHGTSFTLTLPRAQPETSAPTPQAGGDSTSG